ncbi:zinc finger protein 668-like [Phlebotomus argentipes]|uniref:zinc finger protein 668-like n=1 Tax=Phlebotomus argentipes TaxID=94469 RepID=UPI0028929DD6|nr:zinc finger protein 668-like [Phlebotomus argentipes]
MEENSMDLMDLIDEFLRDSLEFAEELLCHVCGEKLVGDATLQHHLEGHGDSLKGLKCLFCSKSCCDMNDHIADWDFTEDLLDMCQIEEDAESEKQVSDENPEGEKTEAFQEISQCEICGKIMLRSSVGSHLRTKHSSKKPFECEKCGRCYKSRGSLKFHQENHRKRTKSWTCEKCGSSFFDEKSLQAHVRRIHGQYPSLSCCPVCEKSFRTPYDLKYHRETVHPTSEKRFKCQTCCLPFKGLQGLRRHEAKHCEGEVLPFECSYCDVKFTSQAPCRRHEENCSGQMKYPCKFCPEKFTTYIRLRGHRRREHKEKILRRKPRKSQGSL